MYATINKWAAHFKMGKDSLEDNDRCGGPTTATEENIAHVHTAAMGDIRFSLLAVISTLRENVLKVFLLVVGIHA